MFITASEAGSFSKAKLSRICLLLVSLAVLSYTLVAQTENVLVKLEVGKPIERELAGDAAHSYTIFLTSGQYLHAIVEQKGIDIVVTLFAPDGKKLTEVDSPNGAEGPEPLYVIAEATGTFRLEIRSLDAKATVGRYEVLIEQLRAAQPSDKSRVAAQSLLVEASEIESGGNADSLRKAISKFEEAIVLLHDAGDVAKEAETLNYVGIDYDTLGDYQKARDAYSRAFALHHSLGDRSQEAATLSNIGGVYVSLGEPQKSFDYYNQALLIDRVVGNKESESTTLTGIGNAYRALGDNQKALDYLNQALQIQRLAGIHDYEASSLNNIAAVYDLLGEKQKALDYYNQALPLYRAANKREGEAHNLSNIGLLYASLGEMQMALNYYNQALPIAHEVGDRRGEAYILQNIGYTYHLLDDRQKALRFYDRALPLFRTVGDRGGEGLTLHNIGLVYKSLRKNQLALKYYNQALAILRAAGDRRGEAYAVNSVAIIYDRLGQKKRALDFYNQALTLRRAVGDRGGEAFTLANIATFERDRGNLTEALSRIEAALTIVESLRTKIGSRELRSSYFATVQNYYEFYIDLLMRLHRQRPTEGLDGKALQASERGRARSLLEMLAEANANIRQGVDPLLLERELYLQNQLNIDSQIQMKMLAGKHTDEQAKDAAGKIESLTTVFQQVEASIRQSSPRYAALTQPQPLSIKEIQTQVLDADTVLLEYSLGVDHSYLWAVTPDSITSYTLPKRDEIETLARSVYSLLTDAKRRWKTQDASVQRLLTMEEENPAPASQDDLKKLSRILLSPVAALLGTKRLVIVADGALQYIPFGALLAPSGVASRNDITSRPPLIVEHEIVSLPSVSTLAVLRREVNGRKPAAKTIAVLADPVFESNDERVQHSTNPAVAERDVLPVGLERSLREGRFENSELAIPRLPGTRAEAKQILSLVPPGQSIEAFDFAANRQTAMSDELSQYRYLHFATHGFLNSLHPELSGLVFSMVDENGKSQNGFLRSHEIFNLKLPAELVVLSACQTGLGKEIKGEGLVGLTRGFMYAGAPRVVVSMWSVSDAATAELMARFYRGIFRDNMRPAAALRAAQVSLMKEKKWEAPYFWAAFNLQGEWK